MSGQIASAAPTIADFKKSFTGANDYGAYTMSAYLTCGKAGGANATFCFVWVKQFNFGA